MASQSCLSGALNNLACALGRTCAISGIEHLSILNSAGHNSLGKISESTRISRARGLPHLLIEKGHATVLRHVGTYTVLLGPLIDILRVKSASLLPTALADLPRVESLQ
jgi:hypothetical protein